MTSTPSDGRRLTEVVAAKGRGVQAAAELCPWLSCHAAQLSMPLDTLRSWDVYPNADVAAVSGDTG
jgi:hypothetical protein